MATGCLIRFGIFQNNLPLSYVKRLPQISLINAGMTGTGELWVNTQGLPIRQIIHLELPPSNDEQVVAEFNVNFFLNNGPDRRGELIFKRLACWSCHGEQGVGGIDNPNAAPSGEVPPIRAAANDYDLDELKGLMSSTQSPEPLDPQREPPPFSCPDYESVLNDQEQEDLYAYLVKLAPKKRIFKFK